MNPHVIYALDWVVGGSAIIILVLIQAIGRLAP
jgi:hypothetical protein